MKRKRSCGRQSKHMAASTLPTTTLDRRKHGTTGDCTEDDWNRTIQVNLTGTWLCMKHELRQLLSQRSGVIVNTSSTAGLVGYKGASVYSAASHGIVGLTKSAALEYAEFGIRINAICAGTTRTPMIEHLLQKTPQAEPHMTARIHFGGWLPPRKSQRPLYGSVPMRLLS